MVQHYLLFILLYTSGLFWCLVISVVLWFLPLDVPGVLNCEGSVSLRGVDKPPTSKTDVSFGVDLKKKKQQQHRYCYFLLHDRNHFQSDSSYCLSIHNRAAVNVL